MKTFIKYTPIKTIHSFVYAPSPEIISKTKESSPVELEDDVNMSVEGEEERENKRKQEELNPPESLIEIKESIK